MTVPSRTTAGDRYAATSDTTRQGGDFNPIEAVDDLLSEVDLSAAAAGGSVSFAGADLDKKTAISQQYCPAIGSEVEDPGLSGESEWQSPERSSGWRMAIPSSPERVARDTGARP